MSDHLTPAQEAFGFSEVGSLVNAALSVFGASKDIRDGFGRVQQIANPSLTKYTNKTTIRSRAYIDESASRERICGNILRTSHALCVSMVIQALRLNTLVTKGHTVLDNLTPVMTNGMEAFQSQHAVLQDMLVSLEAIGSSGYTTHADMKKDAKAEKQSQQEDAAARKAQDEAKRRQEAVDAVDMSFDENAVAAPPKMFPIGKVIDVTMSNPEAPGNGVVVPLVIQIQPYIVKDTAAAAILAINSRVGLRQRWNQVASGEISFWKDFVFQMDRVKKIEELKNADTTGALGRYLDDVSRKDASRINQIYSAINNKQVSSNLANTILVITEDTVRTAAKSPDLDYRINIHNDQERERFFAHSYVMMIFVIDTAHNIVTLYMNGVDGHSAFSFSDFESEKKSNDTDIIKVMAALSDNRTPRF